MLVISHALGVSAEIYFAVRNNNCSRRADGRAVLRSSIREYVASEAMAALGVSLSNLCHCKRCSALNDEIEAAFS